MRKFRYYDIILASFAAVILIANISATKIIAFGPLITDGGVVLFPLIYIFGDILTEVYGYKYARRVTWTGFAVMALAVFSFTIVGFMPSAAEYQYQQDFQNVLGFLPRITVASLAAFLAGEFINSFILAKMKVRMGGKWLWSRLIGSTLVGQLFDTTIFCLIAFGGIITGWNMVIYIALGWFYKTAVEVILLPVTYKVIKFLKKHERVDHYDKSTNFSPFIFKVD